MNTVAEFQARRRKVWRMAGPWILIGVFGALAAILYGDQPSAPLAQRVPMLIAAGGFFLCIIIGAVIVNRHYRCPACGRVPSARNGILFGPSECRSCGARLK
jgi:peptidoglycan/LPS O-acetylase OafA/YrhL